MRSRDQGAGGDSPQGAGGAPPTPKHFGAFRKLQGSAPKPAAPKPAAPQASGREGGASASGAPQAAAPDPSASGAFRPGLGVGTVRAPDGRVVGVPAGWVFVPAGDAALTRRLKATGPCWVVQELVRRKLYSHGLWTAAERVEPTRAALAAERSTDAYARKLAAGRARRAEAQAEYVEDFAGAVVDFLGFHPTHAALAARLARAIADHATPVGSGTVARTERIPIEQRAEAATIAWLRHQTTAYDRLSIPKVKGLRREVRQQLAAESRRLLTRYRHGDSPPKGCPLLAALPPQEPSP